MVIGVARAGMLGRPVFKFNISSSAANQNLRTLANAAGYSGVGDVQATILSGVDIYSTTTATAALVPGSFPSGAIITLVNNGYISGMGGAGGGGAGYTSYGSYYGPSDGGAGGTALDASAVSGFT